MQTNETPSQNQIREELKLLLGDDLIDDSYVPRDGIEISMFNISPSEEHLKGARGLKIKHLPLNQGETEVLGLDFDPNKPVRVTLLVLSPNQEKEWIKKLLSAKQPTDNIPKEDPKYPFAENKSSWLYYAALSDDVLGQIKSNSQPNAQTDFLKKSVEESPEKELLIIFGHGLLTKKFEPQGKLVGSFDDDSVEYIERILEAEDLRQYSAVIDGACNSDAKIPHFHSSPTPYFGALTSVNKMSNLNRGIIIQNGHIEEF